MGSFRQKSHQLRLFQETELNNISEKGFNSYKMLSIEVGSYIIEWVKANAISFFQTSSVQSCCNLPNERTSLPWRNRPQWIFSIDINLWMCVSLLMKYLIESRSEAYRLILIVFGLIEGPGQDILCGYIDMFLGWKESHLGCCRFLTEIWFNFAIKMCKVLP